jgi:hypothetical protein
VGCLAFCSHGFCFFLKAMNCLFLNPKPFVTQFSMPEVHVVDILGWWFLKVLSY